RRRSLDQGVDSKFSEFQEPGAAGKQQHWIIWNLKSFRQRTFAYLQGIIASISKKIFLG
ncbi:unnamed protein product, partial [Amoebophrya sp. A25]